MKVVLVVVEKKTIVFGKGDFSSFGPHGETLYHHLADKETETQRGPPICPEVTQLMNVWAGIQAQSCYTSEPELFILTLSYQI